MQAASEEEVRQVIYISKPTHFDHLVVVDILTKSRAKNPAAGITALTLLLGASDGVTMVAWQPCAFAAKARPIA